MAGSQWAQAGPGQQSSHTTEASAGAGLMLQLLLLDRHSTARLTRGAACSSCACPGDAPAASMVGNVKPWQREGRVARACEAAEAWVSRASRRSPEAPALLPPVLVLALVLVPLPVPPTWLRRYSAAAVLERLAGPAYRCTGRWPLPLSAAASLSLTSFILPRSPGGVPSVKAASVSPARPEGGPSMGAGMRGELFGRGGRPAAAAAPPSAQPLTLPPAPISADWRGEGEAMRSTSSSSSSTPFA